MPEQKAFNMDCMDAMRTFPDKFFDLAVVDPPYGDGGTKSKNEKDEGLEQDRRCHRSIQVSRTGGGWSKKFDPDNRIIAWDIAPQQEYFDELFRISRNQIIWGGNYFQLPPTRCFLIWRKINIPLEGFTMASAEYAWTSFNQNAKMFEFSAAGQPGRFHPTQKPVELYAWIYKNYSEQGMKILDTHLGSGSSRIAAYEAGLDFWGYEIDKTYFDLQEERFAKHTAQMNLFID